MSKLLFLVIGALGYVIGMAGLVLFILFASGWRVGPMWIDEPASAPVGAALIVNLCLVGVFGVQHTVMARPWFKRWWTVFVPKPIERSVYCVATTAAIVLLCYFWQPLPGIVWSTSNEAFRIGLTGLQTAGWVTAVASSFMISHTELFGLQQVGAYARGRETPTLSFTQRGLYRFVRHPLQFGILVGLWAAPHMTTSHMFFSAILSAYVLIGLHHEERDLVATFGDDYLAYRRRVPMLLPFPKRAAAGFEPATVGSPADSAA